MRHSFVLPITFCLTVILTSLTFTTQAHAGFMFEMDYINQGRGALYNDVEGGSWVKDSLHFYWRDEAPDLNALVNTNSIRCSLWKTDKNGDPTKHYVSMVGDLHDWMEESFMSTISRMNVLRDTRNGLYANLDFYEEAGAIKKIDEAFESFFHKVFKQDGKGALGWTGNMLVGGIYKLVSKFTPLDKISFILDPMFGSPSLEAYIPNYDKLYDGYKITANISPQKAPELEFDPISIPEINIDPTTVPEPASATLVMLGLATLTLRPRRTQKLLKLNTKHL